MCLEGARLPGAWDWSLAPLPAWHSTITQQGPLCMGSWRDEGGLTLS